MTNERGRTLAENGTLTRGQKRFVAAALGAPSIKAAAEQADVGYRTAWRYLQEPVVKRALGRRLEALTRQVLMGLAEDCKDARATLRDVMLDTAANDSDRIRAAKAILDSTLHLAELVDLADRVAVLEERMQ